MSIKTLLCSFYKSSAAMQQKAIVPVVILSGLACIGIRALLCEPVSAPGGHSPSHLTQGSLLVDIGPLISLNNHGVSSQNAACSISSHPAATLVGHGQTCPLLNIPPFCQSPDSGIGSRPFLGTRSFAYKSSCCPHWSRGPLLSESYVTATVLAKASKALLLSFLWRKTWAGYLCLHSGASTAKGIYRQ